MVEETVGSLFGDEKDNTLMLQADLLLATGWLLQKNGFQWPLKKFVITNRLKLLRRFAP